jgi:DNA (cytosine-5)-methyltransferase 1
MGRVLGDLAEIGYDAEWEIVSAADVGAPHLRERVWILAYTKQFAREQRRGVEVPGGQAGEAEQAGLGGRRELCDTASEGFSQRAGEEMGRSEAITQSERPMREVADTSGAGRQELDAAAVAVAVAEGFDTGCAATSRGEAWWPVEPDVGRVAHGIPARVDRLRGLGNAVVPQIPELYAHRIKQLLEAW